MKKMIRNFIIAHVFILGLMFVLYKEMTLLTYINCSFIIGGILTFLGLVSYIFSTGFFDVFAVTMRKVITPKRHMEDVNSMRPPSEIYSASVTSILGSGGLILATMGVALLLYYVI